MLSNMFHLEDYAYSLPEELVAQEPASPRDSARLFVYDTATDSVSFDIFRNLGKHLPEKSLLVMNDTRVLPARLWLTKPSGGRIQVLLLLNEIEDGDRLIPGIVDRKLSVGTALSFRGGATLTPRKQKGQYFYFETSVSSEEFRGLLYRMGETPIPPYIKKSRLSERELRVRYQSVFAKNGASVAAPTASLHFTNRLLRGLSRSGTETAHVTLDVGMGTFAPVDEESLRTKRLHEERYAIPREAASAIERARNIGKPIIPVGTTALRTLESWARNGDRSGTTRLFIYPPYRFKVADALITNFHVPRSSLMLLVDAFLEHKKAKKRIFELYDIAIRERFRFFSFGDGMLVR